MLRERKKSRSSCDQEKEIRKMKYSRKILVEILQAADGLLDAVERGAQVEATTVLAMLHKGGSAKEVESEDGKITLKFDATACGDCRACEDVLNMATSRTERAVDALVDACLLAHRECEIEEEGESLHK